MENKENKQEEGLVNQTTKLIQRNCENERFFLRKMIGLLSLSFIGMISFVFILFFNQNYFIIQPDGQVQKLQEQKLELTYDMLYKFADTVVLNTFNYSVRDINQVFDRNSLYYTEVGMNNLKQAFAESNTILYTIENALTKSTIPNNAIYKVTSSKLGVYVYRSYSSEEITKSQRKIIPNVIYEIDIYKEKNNGYLYQLKVNGVKEYTVEEYNSKFGLK